VSLDSRDDSLNTVVRDVHGSLGSVAAAPTAAQPGKRGWRGLGPVQTPRGVEAGKDRGLRNTRRASAEVFEAYKQETRERQRDMLMQDQRVRVQQGFEQLARTGTFADARVEVSFQLARSWQGLPARLVGMFGLFVATSAAVVVDWQQFANSQPLLAEEAGANAALRRQAGTHPLRAASSDTLRAATGDGGGLLEHEWGRAYLAAVVAVAVMGVQLLVTILVTFGPQCPWALRSRLPCTSPVVEDEWQQTPEGPAAAGSLPGLSAGQGVESGGLASLSTRRGWGVVLSRDVPSMAFAMACYVCWFGAVKFMDETDTVVQGRGWIASFNWQLPKFYFLLQAINVLLQLPLTMAWLVLIFQMVVFIVTDAITPNFEHSLQVGCAGTPMRKDFYFSIIFPVVSSMLQAYSRNIIQRQCFRMQACAQLLVTHVCSIAENLMPPHVIQRIQAARAGQAQALQKASGDHGKIESTFAESRPHVVQMFSDVEGFTQMAASLEAEDTFLLLSQMWDVMDAQCQRHGVTKVETIGDAYWCAMGLDQDATPRDAQTLLGMALHLQETFAAGLLVRANGTHMPVRLRIAVHYGPVVEGVVGWKMPRYQLFGRSVDKTMALEQSGSTRGVVMSRAFSDFLDLDLGDLQPAAKAPSRIHTAVQSRVQPVGREEASVPLCSESRTPASAESLVSKATIAAARALLRSGQGSSSTIVSTCSEDSNLDWTWEASQVAQEGLLPKCQVQVLTGMQVAVFNYTPAEVQWRALIENLDVIVGLGPGAEDAATNQAPQDADPATWFNGSAVLTAGRNAPLRVTQYDASTAGNVDDEEDDVREQDNRSVADPDDARARERRERESVRVSACCMYASVHARSMLAQVILLWPYATDLDGCVLSFRTQAVYTCIQPLTCACTEPCVHKDTSKLVRMAVTQPVDASIYAHRHMPYTLCA